MLPTREWMREKIAADPDLETDVVPAPRTGPVVFARSNGHEWAHWDFKSMSLVCCNQCGIVRRADDQNKPCKGKVRVALR